MSTSDILNIFLILGLSTFIVCTAITTFFVVQALKAVQGLAEDLKDTTQSLKDKAGLKMLAALPPILIALVGKIIRRGR